MDDLSFRRLAIDSAEAYLEYLEENDRGISVVNVSEIAKRGEKVFLRLQGRLSPVCLDSIRLRLYADEYPPEVTCPFEYYSERGVLVLRPKKALLARLPTGKCSQIAVISDLRFLVRRVIAWYEKERPPISLPVHPPCVEPPDFSELAGGAPTMEQYSAVRNVLTTPFSYVWGAPGTGKTRYVLANCVLAYLRRDEKIILTAPTNNALEQMLSGVLEVLFSCGIPSSRVLRLGIPSASFAAKYPDVCEQRSTEAMRTRLTNELDQLRRQLNDAASFSALHSFQAALHQIDEQLQTAETQLHASWVPDDVIQSARSDVDRLQASMDNLSRQVQKLSIWFDSFPGRLCRFFQPGRFSERTRFHERCSRSLRDTEQEQTAAIQQLHALEQQKQAAGEQYHARLDQLRTQYLKLARSSPVSGRAVPTAIPLDSFPSYIRLARGSVDKAIEQAPIPSGMSADKLEHMIHTIEEQLMALDTGSKSRWSEVRVLAMTVDRYISPSSPSPDYVPVHIFMDEAAYCSLIKGYTLLESGCPVTLLGDHAQLPPICEMSESVSRQTFHPELLWAQSAVHLESIFQKTAPELYADYKAAMIPSFSDLQRSTLSITHRFGPGLSRVLADFIYGSAFSSAISSETRISYIHAPTSPKDTGRTSQAECSAITALTKSLNNSGVDFAVLTPYRNQVSLLSKAMPYIASAEKIMTIHASQGREFQTVILSIVDTTNKFYTNSSVPIGRSVLNTAVSRVKSDLILVLDYEYWITQERQLIGNLLRLASPCQLVNLP